MQDTIEIRTQDGAVAQVPVVAAFLGGRPVDVTGMIEPHKCDHAGSSWSSDLGLRCPRCGVRLFVPGWFLKFHHALSVQWMERAWRVAGCPPWGVQGWAINPKPWPLDMKLWGTPAEEWPADAVLDQWMVTPVCGFEELGGLPIRDSRMAEFVQTHGTALRCAESLQIGGGNGHAA